MSKPLGNSLDKKWDTSTRQEFYDYYAEMSASEQTRERFCILRDSLLLIYRHLNGAEPVDVMDVGCNSGSLSRLWAEKGYKVSGIDINESLLELARRRANEDGFDINFRVGSATELPYQDESFDIVCVPELLEHVEDWQSCLREASRVVRPGGIVFVSTTNWLCPRQNEFSLPFYSWYPGILKRHFERLAFTTRPELANYATYPAIHWFSTYELKRFFAALNMRCLDRFDILEIKDMGGAAGMIIKLVCRFPGLRFCGHVATPATSVVGYKPKI